MGATGGSSSRSPTRPAVIGVLGVAAVAALVLAASRGSATGGALPVRGPNLGILAGVVFVAALALGLAALVSIVRRLERGELRDRKRALRDLLLVVILVAALLVGFELQRRGFFGDPPGDEREAPSPADPDAGVEDLTTDAGNPWLSVAILAVAAGAAAWFALRNRTGPALVVPESDGAPLARAVGELLDDVIDDLRREPDARQAIIRAYSRMEEVFAHYELPRRLSEAPLEFLARALERISSPEPSRRLTDLFERAMFSTQQFDRAQQDDAIDALLAVRDDLRRPVGGHQ